MGKRIAIVNPGKEAAKRLVEYFDRHETLELPRNGKQHYFVTDSSERFQRIGEQFLKTNMLKLELVTLREY